MSTPYSNKQGSAGNRPKNIESPENFLEALKGLAKGTVSEIKTQAKSAVLEDIPSSFGLTNTGTLKPNESVGLGDIQAAEERGYMRGNEDSSHLRQMWEREHRRLQDQEAQSKQQIQPLLNEIRELAKSMGSLAQEVQIATMQIPVNPGAYHKNFFAHLKSMLAAFRRKVDSSRDWLTSANQRAGKKGHYWSNVSTSGTKFMLSSERYMVTSTG